ncbi:NADP-dependent oxidoreductase [Pseudonocardia petroleophila]|uniref:NADP-dependent oxidoreductase n=1 Tax=Pseudonocardia petroleophila TaxID=37331 RepID=A0A7G7MCI4_9PSEU|nr:NADP-dependent oxidoreductase [Pseudonocardia petroleophila]QNG50495.1 NADP-dependent oxidoreductase [Pseudonocardia petroleophila]
MPAIAREVRLTRPGDLPLTDDAFTTAERVLSPLAPGQVLVRVRHLSLDPYQRIRIRSLTAGDTPPAGAVGQIVASREPALAEGTWVTGELDWADHVVVDAGRLTAFEPDSAIPLHHYVGLLGLSGLTAYFGVTRVLRPREGEHLVVSGASGGVGQVALQIARRSGARVLGLVGSDRKRDALADLGLSALDHHDEEWPAQLAAWAPDGVDGYFDNVWGSTSARVVEQLRPRGRIALCGQMTGLAAGRVPPLDIDWYLMLTRSLTLQGFRTIDYLDSYSDARAELAQWVRSGDLHQAVNLVAGLDAAGTAFVALVGGTAVGKTIVDIGA